jgi:hypothetical protein
MSKEQIDNKKEEREKKKTEVPTGLDTKRNKG